MWPVVFNWLYRNDLKLIDSYIIICVEPFLTARNLPDLGNSLFLSPSLEHNIIYLSVSLSFSLSHTNILSLTPYKYIFVSLCECVKLATPKKQHSLTTKYNNSLVTKSITTTTTDVLKIKQKIQKFV